MTVIKPSSHAFSAYDYILPPATTNELDEQLIKRIHRKLAKVGATDLAEMLTGKAAQL